MADGGQPDRPAILVLSCTRGPVEREVLAGIEEEGVPFVVERCGGAEDANILGRRAAGRSTLGVGVGIDGHGRVSVRHQKLAESPSGLSTDEVTDPQAARTLGHNAARLVVGIPLRTEEFP
ncbi:glycerol dehydratase reactivase beta/small subunit family protein [Mycolicibacterium vanbaalenii]|nr:glycerol dehydratase reactivase beta/small subunit family protein [Mycolicibacterium vanbaalenii]